MTALQRAAFSWRTDAAVPAFDDSRPLIVFDGMCVFCSRSMQFIAGHEVGERLLFTPAQSTLGDALMRHCGLPTGDFETMLLIENGFVFETCAGIVAIGKHLRRPWRWAFTAWRLLPGALGERAYAIMARRRYHLFGRLDRCVVPDASWRSRVIS